MTNDATNPVEVTEAGKSRRCPFCEATPHHGLTKVRHCQLHGDPYQNFAIWCPRGCARIERPNEKMARKDWEGASRATDKTLAAELRKRADALLISDEMPDSAALYSLFIRILTSLEGQG